jgi:hypothetical protein
MAANGNAPGQMDTVPGESPIGAFLLTGETFYRHWLAARNASGLLVEPSAVATLLPGGYIDRSILTAAAGDDTDQANVITGLFSVPMLSTSTFAASDGPLPIYFHNNREFAKSNSGRSVAGVFLFLDPARPTTHCIARIGAEGAAIGKALERSISAASRNVRGVVYSNVSDLTAFTVAATDLTFVEGDRVLLAAQSTAAQCGIYVVGTVATGTAPLTRAADMPSGARLPNGIVVEVSEGTVYAGSSWKAMSTTTGGFVVGTNDPVFYPRVYKQTVTLASGTYTIGVGSTANPDEPLFLWSTTLSMVQMAHNTTGGTIGTAKYAAPVGSRVAGKAGTGVVVVNSLVDAGTVQGSDTSTVDVLITNW